MFVYSISYFSFFIHSNSNSLDFPVLSDQDCLKYRKMVKACELNGKTKEELISLLTENRGELFTLRVAQIGGGAASKIAKIKSVRKNIARILTVHNQQQKLAVRKAFSGSKYLPRDLRKKTTRAKRRALTKEQLSAKTLKQQKKDMHFPQRVYAVKA